ncbi:FkbM family methyltransferase [Methylotenera sp. L2L1]|uniref:FkbM family methyltransferase n=1 Tax=Methylotenera sp. L2L1 TaxID=1502770 RepID=UPI0005654E0A|nr:FkbM family methyltransferase [Methylotenera sp. L2L1]
MSFLSKVKNKLTLLFRRYILREPFLLEVSRWFDDNGDETLRLDYPLNKDSIVFDLGGYHGDFAAAIHEKFGCTIYIFEPVPEFYQMCVDRFQGNKKIVCLNYGLSSADGWLDINMAENASSFTSPNIKGSMQRVQVRSVVDCIRELMINQIDLMKINIEGGEFDVVPAIIESGDIKKVQYLQVQFHNFLDNAAKRRETIRHELTNTHTEMWSYDFVWESWKLKGESR